MRNRVVLIFTFAFIIVSMLCLSAYAADEQVICPNCSSTEVVYDEYESECYYKDKTYHTRNSQYECLNCEELFWIDTLEKHNMYSIYDEDGPKWDGDSLDDEDVRDSVFRKYSSTKHKFYNTYYCSDCNNHIDKTEYEDHTWGSWHVTKKATPFVKGSKYRKCKYCGQKQTAIIKRTKKSNWSVKNKMLTDGKTDGIKIKPGESTTVDFGTSRKLVFQLDMKVESYSTIHSGGFRVICKNKSGKSLQNDYVSLKGLTSDDWYENWFYPDKCWASAGDYKYIIKNTSDKNIYVNYTLYGYTKIASKANMKKKVERRSGNWVTIGKLNAGIPIISIKSSNYKIVSNFDVTKKGNIKAYARKKGTAKVTVTLHNGHKYTTTVKVKAGDPNFFAELVEYNTRDNYFKVRIKNFSVNPIYIVTANSKVEDKDYKSYDRYLTNTKTIKIKYGETKYIKYYVRGSTTWPDYTDFTLLSHVKYEGKTHSWHVWHNDSVYKIGKSWYNTYWDEYAYDDWL